MPTNTIRQILSPDFTLAFFSQFVFSFVFHSLIPTLPIYLSRSGSNELEIGVLIGIFAVSSLVIRPFIGKALLKTPEKTFMIAGSLLFAFTCFAYLFSPPFWPFLIVRLFQGFGFAFYQTASITLIANISLEGHRGQSISYYYLALNLAGAIAPSLGIFFINHFSFTILFLVCSGLSLGSVFITSQLGRRQIVPSQDASTEDGLFFSRKALPPSMIHFFFSFTYSALAAFFPLHAINHGVANPGLFFTTIAIMLILGRALGGKMLDLYSPERITLPCLITAIVSMAVLAFSKTLPLFVLVAVIWGIGHAFLIPTLAVYTLNQVGSSPGPAMGTLTAISDLGRCLGPLMMGIILHMSSYPTMFLSLAFTGIVNLNYFYFFVRKKG